MDAVILFSHGSLLCGFGDALLNHAARLRSQGTAPIVEIGYLNHSEPLFPEAVARCASLGASRIIVAPYFLVPGYFVEIATPKSVDTQRSLYTNIEFVVAAPIGFDARLADAILDAAREAMGPERWRDNVTAARTHCRQDPRCPLFASPVCAVQPRSDFDRRAGLSNSRPTAQEQTSAAIDAAARTALVVIAHGSPNPDANADMQKVIDVIRGRTDFNLVQPAFLECNSPSIPEAMEACIASGARSIVTVPYFLHAGRHVVIDLPELLDATRERHPSITLRLGPHIGCAPLVTDILADRINKIKS